MLNLNVLTYNLIVLYNIKQEIKNTTDDLCEITYIKNQLQPLASIF